MKVFIVDSIKHNIYKPFAHLDYAMHHAKHFDDAVIYEREFGECELQAWGIDAPFIIQCDKPPIYRTFANKDDAIIFAEQLAKDYPQAHIERVTVRSFTDEWGDE